MTENVSAFDRYSKSATAFLGIFLCLFTLFEVNYNLLKPQSALAIFVGVGLALCFLTFPIAKRFAAIRTLRSVDVVLAIAALVCCGYVVVQTEPLFESFWSLGMSLGDRPVFVPE